MANPKVKVEVGADGAGFNREMDKIEKRIHGMGKKGTGILSGLGGNGAVGSIMGLFENVGEGASELAGEMTGLVGVFAGVGIAVGFVATMTEKLMEFSHGVKEASERLNISTDSVQRLRFAAELAGKDFGAMEKSMGKAVGFANKAISNPGGVESNVAKKLGFTQDDLKELKHTPDKLMEELIKRAQKFDINSIAPDLEKVFGKGSGRSMYVMGEKLEKANKYTLPLAPAAIDMLVDEWEKMKVVLHDVFNILAMAIAGLVGLERFIRVVLVDGVRNAIGQMLTALALFSQSVTLGKENKVSRSLKEVAGKVGVTWDQFKKDVKGAFGHFEKKEGEKADTLPEKKSSKAVLDKRLEGNDQFLKIGGLMGIDAAYRLERLSQKTNDLLAQIVKNTEPDETPEFEVDGTPPF